MTTISRRFVVGATVLVAAGLSVLAQAPRPAAQRSPRAATTAGSPIRVLVLAPEGETHDPVKMMAAVAPALARRGIQLTYATNRLEAIEPARLAYYDAVIMYGDRLAAT
jgi:hypothetical protein